MGAAIYTRISNDPTGKAAGVTRQMKECRALAKRAGLRVAHEFTDNDISATSGKRRPAFEQLVSLVMSGEVDTVVVWHTDRLYRLPRDLEPLIVLAETRPLRFLVVTASELDLNTPTGRMVARMLAAVSANEVEHRADRQRAANRDRVERGLQSTRPKQRPFGFEADGIQHRPDEADALRAGYGALLDGHPLAAIARLWNGGGFTTSREKPWTSGSVGLVLANPRNMGHVSYHREALRKANWEPIVDEVTWRRARAQLAVGTTGRPGYGRTLLGKVAYCGVCGDGTQVRGGSNNGRRSYRCDGPLQHISRSAQPVEDYVEAAMRLRLSQPDAALQPVSADVAPLIAEADQVRARLDALALDYADGYLTGPQLNTASERLRARLSELEAGMAHASQHINLAPLLDGEGGDAWDRLSIEVRRSLVRDFMTVTLLPAPRGHKAFDPASVRIEWRR